MGCTITFSVCSKPFKLLGLPSGPVKSRKCLPEMILTNIMKNHVIHKIEEAQKQ
jgi:hypothetical protein